MVLEKLLVQLVAAASFAEAAHTINPYRFNADAANGALFYGFDSSYCYQIEVGNRIKQQLAEGSCSPPTQQCCGTLSYTIGNIYELGIYQRTTDWIQQFGNGGTCPGGLQRTAAVEFENSDGRMVFSNGATYSVTPSETSTCVYKFVISTSSSNFDVVTVNTHGPPSPSPPPPLAGTFSADEPPPPPSPSPPPPWDDDSWIDWDFQWWWVGMPFFVGLVAFSMVRKRRLQQLAAARRQNIHHVSTAGTTPRIAAVPIPVRSSPGNVTRTVNTTTTTTTTSTVGGYYPTATAVPVTATAIPAYPGSQPPVVEAVAVAPDDLGASFGTPVVVNAVPVTAENLPRV